MLGRCPRSCDCLIFRSGTIVIHGRRFWSCGTTLRILVLLRRCGIRVSCWRTRNRSSPTFGRVWLRRGTFRCSGNVTNLSSWSVFFGSWNKHNLSIGFLLTSPNWFCPSATCFCYEIIHYLVHCDVSECHFYPSWHDHDHRSNSFVANYNCMFYLQFKTQTLKLANSTMLRDKRLSNQFNSFRWIIRLQNRHGWRETTAAINYYAGWHDTNPPGHSRYFLSLSLGNKCVFFLI